MGTSSVTKNQKVRVNPSWSVLPSRCGACGTCFMQCRPLVRGSTQLRRPGKALKKKKKKTSKTHARFYSTKEYYKFYNAVQLPTPTVCCPLRKARPEPLISPPIAPASASPSSPVDPPLRRPKRVEFQSKVYSSSRNRFQKRKKKNMEASKREALRNKPNVWASAPTLLPSSHSHPCRLALPCYRIRQTHHSLPPPIQCHARRSLLTHDSK